MNNPASIGPVSAQASAETGPPQVTGLSAKAAGSTSLIYHGLQARSKS